MRHPFLLLLCAFIPCFFLNAQTDTAGKYFTSPDGTSIYYEVKGDGEPVVLIHGFMNTGESWKRCAIYNALVESGYKVITLDQRGNGRSGKPHNPEAYQNDAEAKDIMGLMKMLGINKYTAIGYSRGAIIASRLLVLDKRIKNTIIGGMGIAFTDTAWPRRIMFYHALMGEPVKELEAMVQNVKKNGLDQLAFAYQQNGQPSTSIREFSLVKKPVLVICGDKDEDNGSAEQLAKLIPQSDFVTVPGDHGGAVRTKEFSAEVLKFLRKKNVIIN